MFLDFLIVLLLCTVVIPPIFNVLYAYIIVKFNLWSGISEFILCDGRTSHNMDKLNIMFLIVPFLSCMCFIIIITFNTISVVYKMGKILLYPFIKVYEFIANGLFGYFNKVEDKRRFFENINNHCK